MSALREHQRAALAAGHITKPVFCTSAGTWINKSNLLRDLAVLVKRANRGAVGADLIPAGVRFHDLRHSHASALIADGASIRAVSRRLGHADISVTLKVYAHCLPDDDVKLANGAEALFGATG
ncbi:MAG TPA: tyrosine-type recombinase/integrase [Gemmataceae bacterium]|nr:tyrosine-type recombinase/integrase [Gemmataceae bacterium]